MATRLKEHTVLDTPHIPQTASQLTAIIHLTIPREDIQKVMGPGDQRVDGRHRRSGH
jgi:hypothetical protein